MKFIFDKFPKMRDNAIFVPFAIDTNNFKPMDATKVREQICGDIDDFLVLGMARQHNGVKGSNTLLEGFAKFHKNHKNSRLVLSRWGTDLDKTDNLIKEFKIQKAITWLPFLPKQKLNLIYNAVDIACDQFKIGCWGSSFPECMSTGTPTLMYYDKKLIIESFRRLPPVPSVKTSEELSNALEYYYNSPSIGSRRDKCREWIKRTHNMKDVANRHKEILEDVLRKV